MGLRWDWSAIWVRNIEASEGLTDLRQRRDELSFFELKTEDDFHAI
jgi:hypothetical protein